MKGTKVLKQVLVFTVTAYLAFSVLFADDGLSRSLEGEEAKDKAQAVPSKVDSAPALRSLVKEEEGAKKEEQKVAKDDATKDEEEVRSLQEEEPAELEVADESLDLEVVDEKQDILVVVMGERRQWPMWKARLGGIDAKLTLLYGSYNDAIPEDEWENDFGLTCQTAFIPDTTWTIARNLLAAEAVRMERRRGKEFDWWVFLDDDVDVRCEAHGRIDRMNEVLGEGMCWQRIFNFLGSDQVPENASSVSLETHSRPGFAAVSTTDAMFAAFKRSHVPFLLPYANLPAGSSEWSSQGALFCIMETCMRSSTILIPFVRGFNPAHRAYQRGLNYNQIMKVVRDNYHNPPAGFEPCAAGMNVMQLVDFVGTYETAEELNAVIQPTEWAMCDPMRARFDGWDLSIGI
mmetsp:Transcript_7438/g.8563  ORF Transcript_7438/g.8563 Transcript_7438/m.8563 type:complete len:403 (+) Transcript_7438:266-1474(+)